MKPFLRWAGSKRKLLPKLAAFWSSDYKRYVEPFMGSACLFFSLRPARALLGDLNKELVATYSEIRDNPIGVWNCVSVLRATKKSYYKLRKVQPSSLNGAEAAARFLFLNRFCFNGLYRTNLRGEFNVPYAPNGTGSLPSKSEFLEYSRQLQGTTFVANDFESTLGEVRRGDFVYLDPPFAVRTRRVFREYGASIFKQDDLERLTKCLKRLDRIGADFVVSYADCREARELFAGWRVARVAVQRNIAGFIGARRCAYELVISNRSIN